MTKSFDIYQAKGLLKFLGDHTECRPVVDLAFYIIGEYDDMVNNLLEKSAEKTATIKAQEMELAGYRMAEASNNTKLKTAVHTSVQLPKSPQTKKKRTPARKTS